MPKTYNDITKQTAWTYYVIMGMSAEEISGLLEPTAAATLLAGGPVVSGRKQVG